MEHHIFASVFGINRLRFRTDGNGITTLVAFLGCPLSCRYCLNDDCHNNNANQQMLSPEQLYEEVKKDHIYFTSTGGGITFGGGEPCLQSSFISRFKEIIPSEWKLNIETSLNIPLSHVRELMDIVDTFIIDIKDMNPKIYREYTGCSNKQVVENLKFLIDNNKGDNIIIRVPEILELNGEHDIYKSVKELRGLGVKHITFITYRTLEELARIKSAVYGETDDDFDDYGHSLCKVLKEIRNDVACQYKIEYNSPHCTNRKPCSGTCPVCEKELEFINQQISAIVNL